MLFLRPLSCRVTAVFSKKGLTGNSFAQKALFLQPNTIQMKKTFQILLAMMILSLAAMSCRKDPKPSDDPSLKLAFSTDTIAFDTVFTTLGSATRNFVIYNNNADYLTISSVRLTGGESSPFRINLDGEAGVEFYDKQIPANDSLFVFLRVTIDPNDLNTPFVVEDEIEFVTNGNAQTVKLVAWGQNAIYIVADQQVGGYPRFKIVADSLQTTYWTNELPYVIYGYALIDSYGTLQIEPGTRIHIHSGGGIWAYSEGQLVVNGTPEQPVVITGDRLEHEYTDVAGMWDRIWLMEARAGAEHVINNAVIRNGFIGVQAESFLKNSEAPLRIANTVIENHTGYGILTRHFPLLAYNTVVDNCQSALLAIAGGSSRFVHCTFGDYDTKATKSTALYLSNYWETGEAIYLSDLSFDMENCIVYGKNENEFATSFYAEADSAYTFDHCLVKTKRRTPECFKSCIFSEDPMFADVNAFDFHLGDMASPAIGTGNPASAAEVPADLDGVSRVGAPDMGAYQYR